MGRENTPTPHPIGSGGSPTTLVHFLNYYFQQAPCDTGGDRLTPAVPLPHRRGGGGWRAPPCPRRGAEAGRAAHSSRTGGAAESTPSSRVSLRPFRGHAWASPPSEPGRCSRRGRGRPPSPPRRRGYCRAAGRAGPVPSLSSLSLSLPANLPSSALVRARFRRFFLLEKGRGSCFFSRSPRSQYILYPFSPPPSLPPPPPPRLSLSGSQHPAPAPRLYPAAAGTRSPCPPVPGAVSGEGSTAGRARRRRGLRRGGGRERPMPERGRGCRLPA